MALFHLFRHSGALGLALASTLAVTACNDLTRTEVERILANEGLGYACESDFDFTGQLTAAMEKGLISEIEEERTFSEHFFSVADASDGDEWRVKHIAFTGPTTVRRKNNPKRCLPGAVVLDTIYDMPLGPSSGSYKVAEYTYVVELPPELEKIRSFIRTRYRKTTTFVKTDRGWRIAD